MATRSDAKKRRSGRGAESESARRTLIYIPIIHTQVDMGAFKDAIKRLKVQKVGRNGWERSVNAIDEFWSKIEQTIDALPLRYENVCVYQDGLPVCGREVEIITELAKAGSRNHQLLVRLKERGAEIMGTESSELLVEEYQLMKEILASEDPVEAARVEARRKALTDSLLERRDRYIAERINNTLQGGETGMLFLGMFHSVDNYLYRDIRVIYPICQPTAYSEGVRYVKRSRLGACRRRR